MWFSTAARPKASPKRETFSFREEEQEREGANKSGGTFQHVMQVVTRYPDQVKPIFVMDLG